MAVSLPYNAPVRYGDPNVTYAGIVLQGEAVSLRDLFHRQPRTYLTSRDRLDGPEKHGELSQAWEGGKGRLA